MPSLSRAWEMSGIVVLAIACHAAVIIVLARGISGFAGLSADGNALTVIFIQPTIRADHAVGPDIYRLTVAALVPVEVPHIEAIPSEFTTEREHGAGIAAPTLLSSSTVSLAPYVAQAALLPGEGATVVLRIEVLENGEPGRIEVDNSSGSEQVDRAAINYARTQRWYAGREGDTPTRMWVRWGVRLQA
jgi:TonB family protein